MSNALIIKDHPNQPERISKRLRSALDMMIWGDETGRPLAYDEAAKIINVSTRSMRKSLERPVVRAYLREQREVFRACLTPRSLWHLAEISAQRVNMNAAVAACRTVLGQDEAQIRSSSAFEPHVTIRIVNAVNAAPPAPVIEHEPQPEHEPQRYDDEGHLLPLFRPNIDRDR